MTIYQKPEKWTVEKIKNENNKIDWILPRKWMIECLRMNDQKND